MKPNKKTAAGNSRQQPETNDEQFHGPVLVSLADVEPEPVSWLWPQRIALGKVTLLAGDPGLGKSFLSLDLAARVSNGAKWPDCPEHAPLGGVVLLSAEDDLGDTIRPRLDAAGADVKRIIALQGVKGCDKDGKYDRPPDLGRDVEAIKQAIDAVADCRLVIIDPVSAYMGKADDHKNAAVRGVLGPLAALAGQRKIAILAVTHLRKGEGQALYRAMGSLAYVAAARAAWLVAPAPKNKQGMTRLFLPMKNNLGNDTTGLAFTLSKRHTGTWPCVEWSSEPVETTAEEALAPKPRQRGPKADERDEAADFLRETLAKGPKLGTELTEQAKEVHGISKSTLNRAKKLVRVVSFQQVVPGPWYWKLPDSKDATSPDTEQLGNLDNLGENTGDFDVFDHDKSQGCQVSECGNLGTNGYDSNAVNDLFQEAADADPDELETF